MKLVLKILALPVLFVVKVICILGNLLTNVVSYVIGLLLLVIGGSAIYCIVKALWQSLLILVVLGIATIAAVFLLVWAVMKVENDTKIKQGRCSLREFRQKSPTGGFFFLGRK